MRMCTSQGSAAQCTSQGCAKTALQADPAPQALFLARQVIDGYFVKYGASCVALLVYAMPIYFRDPGCGGARMTSPRTMCGPCACCRTPPGAAGTPRCPCSVELQPTQL